MIDAQMILNGALLALVLWLVKTTAEGNKAQAVTNETIKAMAPEIEKLRTWRHDTQNDRQAVLYLGEEVQRLNRLVDSIERLTVSIDRMTQHREERK